ncbi:RagB/SusD family nutrient uptake outer membrane protein [Cyclobacterium marinum]|uniref:RagB/SusD domain-containing protein n=1 Tax=Cyclobacterium marinum (strain ATCC 25205 / DSM 745 / LMG 13164 / NCIMB 1802) TaxID=880070 RepID=G0IYX1_CYCMS|nr:RagB/SusD family nutrient uptake outer membrane protein [Cyclobacterium marinum]AEL28116.1 RagB/SusD domain-containing protein [Cyclobacterium marinum DSM 745]
MKKTINLIIIVSLLFSCSEDFLDRQPEDALSTGAFYNNPSEIKAGLAACYAPFQNIYSRNQVPQYLEISSDDGKDVLWQSNDYLLKKNTGNSRPNFWRDHYKVIVNSNNIIDIIEDYTPLNAEEENLVKVYQAEAKFLRALAYFNLVRLYGDVPKVVDRLDDPNQAIGIGRTSKDEIYSSVIIPDLEAAIEGCLKKDDGSLQGEEARATKGAALTILGKVYLTINNPTMAEAILKRLIVDKEAGNYSLLSNFEEIHQPDNKFNEESIFEINYNAALGQPNFLFKWMTNENGYLYGIASGGGPIVMFNFMKEFVEDNDWIDEPDWSRYNATLDSGKLEGGSPELQPWPKKFTPETSTLAQYNITGTDFNYMVTRYADALLMYGEALVANNKASEALPYFNMVRERAGLKGLTVDQLDIEQILHERRVELAFEGHRFFDLVRTGKAVEKISWALMNVVGFDARIFTTEPIEEYQLLLPIPVAEIQKDASLNQNPGY